MLKKDFRELNEKKQELNKFSYYSSMAFQMLIIIFIGVAGGISIDKWLHMKFPVFTIILSLFGVFVAIYITFKDFIHMDKR